jgi:hypothetical protein
MTIEGPFTVKLVSNRRLRPPPATFTKEKNGGNGTTSGGGGMAASSPSSSSSLSLAPHETGTCSMCTGPLRLEVRSFWKGICTKERHHNATIYYPLKTQVRKFWKGSALVSVLYNASVN